MGAEKAKFQDGKRFSESNLSDVPPIMPSLSNDTEQSNGDDLGSNGASNSGSGCHGVIEGRVVPRAQNKVLNALGYLLRTVIFDVPLMMLFASYVSAMLLEETMVSYLIPQVELMKWDQRRQYEEVTYFSRDCGPEDITTNAIEDLMISEDMDATECMKHMLHHGVSLYPDLISDETAKAAREFILKRNLVEEGFDVIENDYRYSFGVQVNSDPSIQQALKEIGEHEQLQTALRKIAGPNPAIVEFTAITSTSGATDQYFHQDVVTEGSAFKWARSFVPTYSLFIPLQEITPDMGPTELCPGSHQCSDEIDNYCEEHGGMLLSGKNGTWNTGTGALYNQQLFHRGTAHVNEDGPARTLLILTFASRPRYNKNQVETRMIGHEGSYSLKWNQWGHTMDDFANAAKQMAEPWMTLRSLGLLKAPGRDWGWDFITVACMRMANKEMDFEPGTLREFVNEGGFTFLPDFLKPEHKAGHSWETYLLLSITMIKEWLFEMNVLAFVGYVAVVVLMKLSMWILGFKGRRRALRQSMGRLVLAYGLVVIIGFVVHRRISTSQWAHNIRHNKAFQGYRSTAFPPPFATLQPATLPLDIDVVKDARYQTSYLASSTQVLDITHPGNRRWVNLVNMNARNYRNLPMSLKRAVTEMVLNEVKTFHGARMLKQDENRGQWINMSEIEELQKAHEDLLKASDEELNFVLTQLGYLEGELGGGVFRESRLHRKEIPALLSSLREKLIGVLDPVYTPGPQTTGSNGDVTGVLGFNRQRMLMPSTRRRRVVTRSQRVTRSSLPPRRESKEPFPGAWVYEGDTVIAKYGCEHNEWYRGVVTKIDAAEGAFDVQYDDGEEGKGLKGYCIRPFVPYVLHEPVGVYVDDEFYNGRIINVHENFRYDVETYTMGVQIGVVDSHLRRFDYEFRLGTVVEARNGDGRWRRGKVDALREASIDIVYDGGEKEFEVPISRFRLIELADETGQEDTSRQTFASGFLHFNLYQVP